jgi:hypothetical protein
MMTAHGATADRGANPDQDATTRIPIAQSPGSDIDDDQEDAPGETAHHLVTAAMPRHTILVMTDEADATSNGRIPRRLLSEVSLK